jgi:cell wall-associated protease
VVTLSGTASGCPNPQYQFWIQPPGGGWTILQAYGTASSVSWNTTGQVTGTYYFDIWVRQSGSSAGWEAHLAPNPSYTLQTGSPCTSVTWNSPSPSSPQKPGTSITFSAIAGGCPNPQYEFWVQAPGGPWTIFQAYSSASSASWNTTGLATGTYYFDVHVKQSGSGGSFEAHLAPNPTYTLQAGTPCTSVTWNAPSPSSPQPPGTSVTFSATASGCASPLYQFWIQAPGGGWTILQAYGANATVTWNTTGLPAGTYNFDVWVKQSGSSADWEAHLVPNPTFTLSP